jgi:hypothetical protein
MVRLNPHRSRIAAGLLGFALLLAAASPARGQDQRLDEDYTARIREATTEPFFLTPYVDHLPVSETVPTPMDILGHIAGAPDVLSYPEEIYRYLRAVAEASPRVEVFSIGQTEEGREMILAVVADEETLARLDDYKGMMAQLADPRTIDDATAEGLIQTAKPMYWATGAMHSGETGSPEMLMELVYRLAVEETPFIQSIRDNVIFMTTPVVEVDGRAKQVDIHMAKRKDPDAVVPTRLLWWGKYVAHDDNRDGIGLSLALSKNINRTYHEFHPLIVHDLHESASHLYTSTGRGPYNAWFDPIVVNEWNNIAYAEVRELTALGVPGVYTHDFYDGWAPNYMFSVANMHNAIGRFYETQGAGDGSSRVIRTNVQREWHRPNTPLREVVWSIRNNVNLQQSALLIALGHVAENRQDFLRNFYRKGKRSMAKATAEGPAAYVLPADEERPALQARLLRLMQDQGIEINRMTDEFTLGDREYPEGSYVIRMDQPYSRAADMLLDKQYYNPDDPRPYDDVGWTLGPLFNVTVDRIEETEILSARMARVEGQVTASAEVDGDRRAEAYLIDYTGEGSLTTFRYAHPELRIEAAEAAFEADDREFNAGTFILPVGDNPENLEDLLQEAAARHGFVAYGARNLPDVMAHPVETPRVAIVHDWSNTQSEGWLRIGFDEYGVPYDYISVHEIRDNPDLRARWDVLVMGPSRGDALSLLRGVQGEEPIPWKKTELTPNLGFVDETDDMRGGLELQGILNLSRFVEEGGVFVTLSNSSVLPIHFGIAEGIQIRDTPNLWARGGVFRARISDHHSPLSYGYGSELGVYFNTAPVFAPGGGGSGRFGGFGRGATTPTERPRDGSTTARRTGRGGAIEQDIVQGRPRDLGKAGVEEFQESQPEEEEARPGGAPESRARIIARFPSSPSELLISGGLRGGSDMANAPALVDAPMGEGHVVMFSFNPFWRGETHGSYALVFNALLHHGYLGVEAAEGEEVVTPESARH